MIHLIDVSEDNWMEIASLKVTEEQRAFLAPPIGIIARGYVYRNCNARVIGIADDGQIVGVALVRDFTDEPVGYTTCSSSSSTAASRTGATGPRPCA